MRAGTVIAGFRIDEELGRGPHGLLHVATQLSLRRRVALELIDAEPDVAAALQRAAQLQAALHHPHVVAVYHAGDSDHGPFVARRLVGGRTLADVRNRRAARTLLEQTADALDAAHAAGLVHGRLTSAAVLVDESGRALLDHFALAGTQRGAAADRRALAALVRTRLGAGVGDPEGLSARDIVAAARARERRPVRLVAALAAAVGSLGAVATLVVAGDDRPDITVRPAPPIAPGTSPLGSTLSAGTARPVDCTGRPPSVNSPACTVVQTRLGSQAVTVGADGVVRRWAVRGAQGTLALQVVRRRADGRYGEVRRSQYERPPDAGPHAFEAAVPVRRGDRVGIELTPGAGLGVRRARAAAALRWLGPLELIRAPRAPSQILRTAAGELLLRVDVASGARLRRPAGALIGDRARAALAGQELDAQEVELGPGAVNRVVLVRLPGRLVVDLLRDGRRLARLPVPDADHRGVLVGLDGGFVSDRLVRLRWLNPGGPQIIHDYAVSAAGLHVIN
ncbi:MAG: hypothetical protein KY433_05835 [Actinobacteria bacterium]|nr:hypothetical protein [Actinomycetota bacterium]